MSYKSDILEFVKFFQFFIISKNSLTLTPNKCWNLTRDRLQKILVLNIEDFNYQCKLTNISQMKQ